MKQPGARPKSIRAAKAFLPFVALILLCLIPAAGQTQVEGAKPAVIAAARARQGDPLPVRVNMPLDPAAVHAELRDASGLAIASARFFRYPEAGPHGPFSALFALPLDLPPGIYSVTVAQNQPHPAFPTESGVLAAASISIEASDFSSEDIRLDTANTKLRLAPDPRKDTEWLAIKTIYDSLDPDAVFMDGSFVLPTGSARRTAFFGDRRRYLYSGGGSETSIHSGIDFALPSGSPVLAPARGKVVFAGKRIVTGLTLVLEHLPGMYSVFMHLSGFVAKPGSIVKRGELVAKSGNTGLSTGPHLHWEIRLGGQPVNPDFFVAHSVSVPEGD